VSAVLANFICDAVSSVPPSELLTAANAELTSHVQALHHFTQGRPQTRVVIVPPLPRPEPSWYNVQLPGFLTHLFGEVSRLGSSQIRLLSPFAAPSEFFETDGVHLKKDAGIQFIQFVVHGVDQVFPVLTVSPPASSQVQFSSWASSPQEIAPPTTQSYSSSTSQALSQLPVQTPFVQASGNDQVVATLNSQGFSSSATQALPHFSVRPPRVQASAGNDQVGAALNSLTRLHHALSLDVQARKDQDNLIFARIKEDLDFEYNKNRENRFTISGLRPQDPVPSGAQERKEFFLNIVSALVLEACPDLDPPAEVTDIFVNMRYGRGPPFIEGKMRDTSTSSAFRIAAAKLAKDESPNFKGLFVANSVTLATRVRIEIMRAIADLLRNATVQAYVQPFSSRPVLHLKMKDPLAGVLEGVNRSYSFVEAVGRWGSQLSQYSLIPAYQRARPAFIGALEQYFVVLKEGGPVLDDDPISKIIGLPSGANSFPVGGRVTSSRPYLGPSTSRPWTRGANGSCGVSRGGSRGGPRGGQSIKRPHSSLSQEQSSTPSKRKNDENETDEEDITLT